MSEKLQPNVCIWPYKDAPEEFRQLNQPEEGDEELLIYVPQAMLDESGKLRCVSRALWFIDFLPKHKWQSQYAGDDWGSYLLFRLPDGSLVAVTEGSKKD